MPSLASDQVFYEDKTDKESLKQVNRCKLKQEHKQQQQHSRTSTQVQALHIHDAFFHSLMVGSKFQVQLLLQVFFHRQVKVGGFIVQLGQICFPGLS